MSPYQNTMHKTLFPQQETAKSALLKILAEHPGALNSSETGTGKTVTSVAMAKELGCPVAVICPKIVVPAWEAETAEWGIEPVFVANYEKLRTGRQPWVKRVRKQFEWALPAGTLVIVDECQKAKAAASLNSNLVAALRRQGFKTLLLSATPCDSAAEMRAIGYCLGLHNHDNFYRWALARGCRFDEWKKLRLKCCDEKAKLTCNCPWCREGREGIERLAGELALVSHKIHVSDLPAEFRDNLVISDPLEFKDGGKMEAAYAEMDLEMAKLEAIIDGDGADPLTITKILRARQKVELLKVPEIIEMTEDLLDEGRSVVIFVNFTATLEALKGRFSVPCGEIQGGQTDKLRQEQLSAWQADKIRIMICNIAAGGVGVSLHDTRGEHPRVSLISPSFNAKEFHQTLGRIHRAGAKSDAVQKILIAKGTIEETVMKLLNRKLTNMKKLTDGNTAAEGAKPAAKDAKTTGPQAHAEDGPSSLGYKAKCPGFEGEQGESEAAAMGTRCHDAMERDDDSKLLNEMEAGLVQMAREAVAAIIKRHGMAGCEDHREIQLDMVLGEDLSTFGTCDRAMIRAPKAAQIDFKFGRGAVPEPEDNYQAKAYALGLFQRFPKVKVIDFYFICPQREEILHGQFTRDQVDALKRELSQVIERARETRARWKRGETPAVEELAPAAGLCDYCSNAHRCPALEAQARAYAAKYEGTPAEQAEVHGSQIDDPARIAELLPIAEIVEKWAAGVKRKARALAWDEGLDIPGYEKVEKAGARKIVSSHGAWEAVSELGVAVGDFIAEATISWAKIARLVRDKAARGAKEKTESELEARLYRAGVLDYNAPARSLQPIRSEAD